MGTWQEYVSKDAELKERLITHAFSRNSNISSFPEFEDALKSPNPSDDRIKNLYPVMDDYSLKELWEDESCRARVRQNTNEEEFNRTYAISTNQQVIRAKPTGEKTTQKQIMVITVPKTHKMGAYTRTFMGKEISVTAYNRSFKSWADKEVRFLQVKKQQGILSIKEVIYSFNMQFVGEERTSSSVQSKYYRL